MLKAEEIPIKIENMLQEASTKVSESGGRIAEDLEKSFKSHPYAYLAGAFGAGLIVGLLVKIRR